MNLPKRKLTRCDVIILVIFAAAVLVCLLRSVFSPDADHFIVQTPESTKSYSLDGSGSISHVLDGIYVHIQYDNDEVWIVQSECPDQTCVNTGSISKPGETIVCVPARLVISIPAEESVNGDEDFIIG